MPRRSCPARARRRPADPALADPSSGTHTLIASGIGIPYTPITYAIELGSKVTVPVTMGVAALLSVSRAGGDEARVVSSGSRARGPSTIVEKDYGLQRWKAF